MRQQETVFYTGVHKFLIKIGNLLKTAELRELLRDRFETNNIFQN